MTCNLILASKLFVDPEEFLALVHHTDKTIEVPVVEGDLCCSFGAQVGFDLMKTLRIRFGKFGIERIVIKV